MDREFQGFELDTPLAGLSVGRGYCRVSGEDYFWGLAIRLPLGQIRLGWQVYKDGDPPAQPSPWQIFARHLVIAAFALAATIALNRVLGFDGQYVRWLISIWAVVLSLHLLVLVMPVLDCVVQAVEKRISQRDRP